MNKIEKALNFLRSYSMRVPIWIRLLMLLPLFVLPVYWAITVSGPYFWVAELQAALFNGWYSPILAFLLVFLFLFLFVLATLVVLGNFFPEKPESDTKMGSEKHW